MRAILHTSAVKTDGTVWTWGENGNGQLGDNTIINRSSPVQIGVLTNWSQVSAGVNSCVALKNRRHSLGLGRGSQTGRVGDNTIINRSSPVQIGALTNWSQVSAGAGTSAAITIG
jgi:alpha-tubulin suppressor-like RCC1 family protein